MHAMRLLYTKISLFFVLLTGTFSAYSQNITALEARKLLETQASAIGVSATDVASFEISAAYKIPETNTTMVYAQQTYLGIPVYNSLKILAFSNGKLVSNTGAIISKIASKVNSATGVASVTAESAVRVAATNTAVTIGALSATNASTSKKINYGIPSVVSEPITAELMWVPDVNGGVLLAWQVQIVPIGQVAHWMVRVNAVNGQIIAKDNYTLTCGWQKIPHLHDAGCMHIESTIPEVSYKTPANTSLRGLQSFATTLGNASYLVSPYPAESPDHAGGTPVVVNNPWNLIAGTSGAATYKWHYDGSTDYTITRGNNVWAQEDRDANNTTFGTSAASTTPLPNLTFNFTPTFNQTPLAPNNQNFMLTNLFYWNNILHDIAYLYGFNEAAGNFQQDNIGRGGVGNDYVIADAQDASGINNANFSTPVDGTRPRMQMFLWNPPASLNLFINTPEPLIGYITAPQSAFSSNNRLQDLPAVTANIEIYRDDFNNNASGCVAAVNAAALAGKIALIDRAGTCQFAVKARNAQNAGAVGVIVVSDPNSNIGVMGGATDNSITIPAVMISFVDGQRIRTELNGGGTVNATLSGVNRDGDVDNGIIAHEYAHGISTRFTGGPANSSCLNNAEQMGEGWSDYYTLLTTTNWATSTVNDGPRVRGIGTYVIGQNPVTGGGIRPFPYSTNMSVNPQTYGTVATYGLVNGQAPVHAIGSVWCMMLWEMTWEIIAQEGINPNLYNLGATGGNSVALRLVNEGMRLQSCNPGFVDGRDAILRADTILYGGKYGCAIWRAFAKRGLGVAASQGVSSSYTDGIQDFRLPAGASVAKLSNKEHASQGEEVTYTLRATCQCTPVTNLRIVDTLPADVTFVSSTAGNYNASNRTVSYSNIGLAASAVQNYTYTVRVNNGSYAAPTEHINDNVPSNSISAPWFSFSINNTVFEPSSIRFRSSGFSYFAQNASTTQERIIFTTANYPLTRLSTLSFWHYYNTESKYDGGVVEIDVDGTGWVDAGQYMTSNGYNDRIASDATGNPLAGRAAFTGSSNGQFVNTILNLSSLAGRSISIRFRFNSDNGVGGEGWYLDDINLSSRSGILNSAELFDNASNLLSTSSNITNINAFTLPVVWGSFTAEKVGVNGILTWETLQEQNTKHFVLERSVDGIQYAGIFTTAARGNSAQTTVYRYTDVLPVKGINYYRIKQVDNDGRFTYSEVRTLRFDGNKGAISVIPNPISSSFVVQIVGNQSLATIELMSMSGQKMATYQQMGEMGKFQVPAGVKPGTYLLRIVDASTTTTQKVIIQ